MTISAGTIHNDAVYRRPKFLEALLKIREEMAREADYDVDLFAEMVRFGKQPETRQETRAPSPNKPARRKRDPKHA